MLSTAPRLFPGTLGERSVALLLGILVLAPFMPTLAERGATWFGHAEYGHGLLMPPVAAWLV